MMMFSDFGEQIKTPVIMIVKHFKPTALKTYIFLPFVDTNSHLMAKLYNFGADLLDLFIQIIENFTLSIKHEH